jgi:hypothetical protein
MGRKRFIVVGRAAPRRRRDLDPSRNLTGDDVKERPLKDRDRIEARRRQVEFRSERKDA